MLNCTCIWMIDNLTRENGGNRMQNRAKKIIEKSIYKDYIFEIYYYCIFIYFIYEYELHIH